MEKSVVKMLEVVVVSILAPKKGAGMTNQPLEVQEALEALSIKKIQVYLN